MRAVWIILAVVAIVLGVAGFVVMAPYGPSHETFVEIAPGTSTLAIAEQLRAAGVIRSTTAFEAIKEFHGGSLKAGEYRFDRPATVGEVYARMQRGDVFTITLLVPEGYNIFDLANAVQAAGLGKRDDFLKAEMQHTELVKAWSPHAQSLEGFLFPDTYKFSRHATPVQMLRTMVNRFVRTADHLKGMDEGTPNPDIVRTVIMASLVEREVHLDAERPVVAGVFENRLALGMPLQTDPAVQYASLLRGTWTGVIHQSELQSDSDYNTYKHAGLPPGPICNPGVASLRAAMHPAKTDYLYFVADANGATRFSKTLAEHNQKVADYRAKSKQ